MPARGVGLAVRLAIGLASVFLTVTAAAQPVVEGRAIFSYQIVDDENSTFRGLHQIYDAKYERLILEPLRLRLSFRGEGSNSTQQFSGSDHESSIWLLQPGGELNFNLPKLTFLARYDLYATKSSRDDLSGSRRVERALEGLVWSPESLPSLALQGYQVTDRDLTAGLDQKEDRFLESLNYAWRGVTLTETAHYTDFRMGSGFDRKTLDLQGQVRFDGAREDGRASVSAYALAGGTRLDETSSGAGAVRAPSPVAIASALYAQDDTPLDARDKPPVSDIRLIDGNLTVRTDIGLGPSAPLYQNLVFDLGRVVALDTVRVSVRDPAGNLVPVQGLLRWDAFTSGDALDWKPISGGAQTNFLFALSAYEVTFQKTSSRYFKIVSFGTSSADAFVTELQAYFHTEFSKGETRRTDLRFVSGSLDVTARPVPWLAFRYYGLVDAYGTTQADRPDYNSSDADHQVSLVVGPDRPLNATVRFEHRSFSSAGAADQTLDGYWGVVQWAVNRNLQTSIEASRTSEHGAEELVADTLRLHQYLRLFRAVELSVDGGVQREEFAAQRLSGRHLFANAVGYFQLTGPLRLTILANFEKTRFSGEGAAALTDLEPHNARYYGELSYRPSSQLALTGRLGYVTGPSIAATTKTYRIEWYPFARGTIGIGTVYDEDVETNGSYRRFRRVQVLPTWQVNRSLSLSGNYTQLMLLDQGFGTPSGVESKTKQLYVTLTWNL